MAEAVAGGLDLTVGVEIRFKGLNVRPFPACVRLRVVEDEEGGGDASGGGETRAWFSSLGVVPSFSHSSEPALSLSLVIGGGGEGTRSARC